MKIILSRKGFDSSAGGSPSIIYNNKFYSIPIPEAGSGIFYKDLVFDECHSYLDVMRDLGIKFYSEAHLDPDLRKDVLQARIKDEQWKPSFGQAGKSQARLSGKGLEKNDIFLFFGWFDSVVNKNGKFEYESRNKKIHTSCHSIFGYFQIDEIIKIDAEKKVLPIYLRNHPHLKNPSFYESPNAIYTSKKILEIDGVKTSVPGAGMFKKYNDELRLSEEGKSRSNWFLPDCFEEDDIKNFGINTEKRELQKIDSRYKIQLKGMGSQELLITDNSKIVTWATDLILNHAIDNGK